MWADDLEVCPGCGWEVDPNTCGCGDGRHPYDDESGHPFVSMGCTCYYADADKHRNPDYVPPPLKPAPLYQPAPALKKKDWSFHKPDRGGWFWYRLDTEDEPMIVQVYEVIASRHSMRVRFMSGDIRSIADCSGHWQGPLSHV